MSSFVVKGCADCPFRNADSGSCNAADKYVAVWFHVVQEKAPENCPLRIGPVVVSLVQKEKTDGK